MIRLSQPDIRDEDIARAVEVLRSGMLVQGDNVAAFERNLSTFADLPYVVTVSSGTAALHLTLKGLGIGPGDTVLAPAFTFPATANVIEAVGAETELCDVDTASYVITPEAIAHRIATLQDKRIKAVIVVHQFGCPARIAQISEICRNNQLLLIEDAACALGTIADGKHPGFYGDAACFSFHPRKAITTGEGGAIITRRMELYQKIMALRNHGIYYDNGDIDFRDAGLNYRLTDFQAALAIGQLKRFNHELARRRKLVALYQSELRELAGLTLPDIPNGHSLQSFMITLDETVSRKEFVCSMLNKGIQTNLGAHALNCLTYYQQKYDLNENSFPIATNLYRHGLVMPLHGALTNKDIQKISMVFSDVLTSFLKSGRS